MDLEVIPTLSELKVGQKIVLQADNNSYVSRFYFDSNDPKHMPTNQFQAYNFLLANDLFPNNMSVFTIDFFDFSSKKIILKGNNGGYLSRIDRKNLNLGQLIEAAKRIKDKYCEFIISQVDDTNYFVFQSDDGRYWTRVDRSNVRIGSNVSSDGYQISQIVQAVRINIDQSYKFRLYVVS